MTVATLPTTAPAAQRLSPDLDAATAASADAHDATRALTDILLGCQHLPAEIYQYVPHLSHALGAVVAASRGLTSITRYATAAPGLESLQALRQATINLASATAALRGETAALANAAAWYDRPAAISPG